MPVADLFAVALSDVMCVCLCVWVGPITETGKATAAKIQSVF